jgi:hypothetical protein
MSVTAAKSRHFQLLFENPNGTDSSPKTHAKFLERIVRIYEQGVDVKHIGQYVRNWYRWARAGVDVNFDDSPIEYPNPRYRLALPALH